MSLSRLYFILTCLNLFQYSLFFSELIYFFPKHFAVISNLVLSFSDYSCDFSHIIFGMFFTCCNKIVEISF